MLLGDPLYTRELDDSSLGTVFELPDNGGCWLGGGPAKCPDIFVLPWILRQLNGQVVKSILFFRFSQILLNWKSSDAPFQFLSSEEKEMLYMRAFFGTTYLF